MKKINKRYTPFIIIALVVALSGLMLSTAFAATDNQPAANDTGVINVYDDILTRLTTFNKTGDNSVLSWTIPAGTYSVTISDSEFTLKNLD
ncbi:MAG: hypothetical protein ACOY31_09370 [Bacillota bacterium]